MHPSPRGLTVVALGLGFALLPVLVSARLWPLWAIFWALGLLLLGLDALLGPRRRDLIHDLRLPDTLSMGQPGEAVLTLSTASRAPASAEVRLDLSDNLVPQPSRLGRLSREKTAFPIRLVASRRGRAEIEAAWIRTTGPLGLMTRSIRIPIDSAIRAVPNVEGVRGAALSFFGGRELYPGLKIEHYQGDGSEFDSLKELQQGADPRTIDWKASARHHRLLGRHFRAERNHQIVLVVDTGRLMAEPLGGIPRLDHAIHAALTLAYVSARSGDRVSFFAFDEHPRAWLEPRGGIGAFRAISQITADLAYTSAEANFTLGLTNLMARLTRRSLCVVLTDFVDTVAAELMLENLGRLAGRHLVVFVALRDPLLGELCAAEPRTMRDLDRAAVADSLLREREVVLRKLRRRGIFCIDAAPSRVGPELVNRYLDIKRRELVG